MSKAHLSSDKLIDVFKVKAANKGDPMYEGPIPEKAEELKRAVAKRKLKRKQS